MSLFFEHTSYCGRHVCPRKNVAEKFRFFQRNSFIFHILLSVRGRLLRISRDDARRDGVRAGHQNDVVYLCRPYFFGENHTENVRATAGG